MFWKSKWDGRTFTLEIQWEGEVKCNQEIQVGEEVKKVLFWWGM